MKTKILILALILGRVSNDISGQCADSTLDNCPPMVSPAALPCYGTQPPMLRDSLGPNITRIGNQFRYINSSGQLVYQNQSRGLARKYIARVPVLNENGRRDGLESDLSLYGKLVPLADGFQWRHVDAVGQVTIYQQRRYPRKQSSDRKPMWRYFSKYYYYNLSAPSREHISKNADKLTSNCWVPDSASKSLWDAQNRADSSNRVTNANWLEGADQPGLAIPYIICDGWDEKDDEVPCHDIINQFGELTSIRPRYLANEFTGSFCLQNFTDMPLNLDVWLVNLTTGFLIERMSESEYLLPGFSSNIPYNRLPNQGFAVEITGTGVILSQGDAGIFHVIDPIIGNRSPDNICRYGTEFPKLNVDYFPGDKFGDKRDLQMNLR